MDATTRMPLGSLTRGTFFKVVGGGETYVKVSEWSQIVIIESPHQDDATWCAGADCCISEDEIVTVVDKIPAPIFGDLKIGDWFRNPITDCVYLKNATGSAVIIAKESNGKYLPNYRSGVEVGFAPDNSIIPIYITPQQERISEEVEHESKRTTNRQYNPPDISR